MNIIIKIKSNNHNLFKIYLIIIIKDKLVVFNLLNLNKVPIFNNLLLIKLSLLDIDSHLLIVRLNLNRLFLNFLILNNIQVLK
jgi:hypothetical protein